MPPHDKTAEALEAIHEQLGTLTEALLGSARVGTAPGLIQRVGQGEADRADLRRLLVELQASVRNMEAGPGRVAMSWAERLALGVLSLLLTGLGALIGHQITGGVK